MHVKLWKCFKCFSFSCSLSLTPSVSLSLSFALQSVSWPAAVKNRLVLLTRAANIQLSWTAVGYWRHIKNHLNRRGKLFPENGLSHKQQVKTAIWMLQSCVWKIITKGFWGNWTELTNEIWYAKYLEYEQANHGKWYRLPCYIFLFDIQNMYDFISNSAPNYAALLNLGGECIRNASTSRPEVGRTINVTELWYLLPPLFPFWMRWHVDKRVCPFPRDEGCGSWLRVARCRGYGWRVVAKGQVCGGGGGSCH